MNNTSETPYQEFEHLFWFMSLISGSVVNFDVTLLFSRVFHWNPFLTISSFCDLLRLERHDADSEESAPLVLKERMISPSCMIQNTIF